MISHRIRSLMLILVAGAAMSCNEPVRPGRADCPEAGVAMTVSSGTMPTFAWTPQCQVSALRVQTTIGDTVYWYMGRDDESLDAPVQYGVVPAGAGELVAPRPLVAGQAYTALLVQQVGIGRVLARVEFTP